MPGCARATSFDYAPESRSCVLEKDDPRRGVYQIESRRYVCVTWPPKRRSSVV